MTGGQADRRAGGQADRQTGGQVYAALPSPHGFCFEVVLGTEPGPPER